MALISEFKKFAMRGNVIDMAVGIIIGGAFGKIVGSFVNDVLMPPLGKLLGGVDFTGLYFDLSGKGYATLEEAVTAGAPLLKYGAFIQTVVDFLIIAFSIFLMITWMNKLQRKEEAAPAAPPPPPKQELLLEEIRDLLKK